MKSKILLLLSLLVSFLNYSQFQSHNWVFGNGGGVNFSTTPTPIPISFNSSINTFEGVACQSDALGSLLFYTDGLRIYDSGGNILVQNLLGANSATQSSIIVPDPSNTNQYYIFTVADQNGTAGLNFYIYDITSPTTISTPTNLLNDCTEKITAVAKGDNSGYWVIAHGWNDNSFHLWEINCNGISNHSIQNVGAVHTGNLGNKVGYMKFNISGTLLGIVNYLGNEVQVNSSTINGFVQVFDFDNLNGIISTSNIVNIGINADQSPTGNGTIPTPYGIEFSPNSQFLYIGCLGVSQQVPFSGATNLYQVDLINGNLTVIGSFNSPSSYLNFGALQTGPDQRIYISLFNENYLGLINNPNNILGTNSIDFNLPINQFPINGTAQLGLPNIISSNLLATNILVTGDSTCNLEFNYTGNESFEFVIWDFGDGATSSDISTSHAYTSSGSYIVTFTGTLISGCIYTEQFSVNPDVTNCCNQTTDSLYSQIPTYVTIYTHLDGKLFIPDNTIITVDNAVLDITNVDLVFGQCAGIDFINGATLRANNSVFRPCNINDTWRGLRFDGESNFITQINENTFKNAEIALLFENNAIAEINSNTFSNCNEGITLNASSFSETIFGNNFITNNSFPEFTRCYPTTAPNDVIHIHSFGFNTETDESVMNILHNNFVMSNNLGNIASTGIDLLTCQAIISENTMTNMNFGIIIDNPQEKTLIEGNEIENNFQFQSSTGSISQIGLFNSNGAFVSINNNELRNSRNDGTFSSTGVFLSRSNNIMIQNNEIEGFNFGINASRSNSLNITENRLSSISNFGIFFDESNAMTRNFITCNDITMIMASGSSIKVQWGSRLTEITSNCLKDGNIGIEVVGQSTIPLIRNNFIYNYGMGISNTGHSGNIGTTLDPGMNTLWSNLNASLDVASTTPITIANNFGQTNCTWGTVSVQGNTAIHSTASCGHQITSANAVSQGYLNTKYTCDNLNSFILPNTKIGENFSIPSMFDALEYFDNNSNKIDKICQMIAIDGFDESYLNYLLENIEMDANDRRLVEYSFYKFNNRLSEAHTILTALDDNEFSQFVGVESILLKKLNGETLSESDFIVLTNIMNNSNSENGIYNLAVSLSKTGQSHGVYKISIPSVTENNFSSNNNDWVHNEETLIEIYPNPASTEIFIQILEGKQVNGQRILIYDLFGNVINQTSLDFISGITKIDISSLASGSYFILLESDGLKSERTKFVKI